MKKLPWISNVAWYSCVFAAGDLAHQNLTKHWENIDLKQTRNITILALTFHGNFVYLWIRAMESLFPGAALSTILWKLACDQLVGTPTGISAFYIGMSILEGKQDIFADWKKNFWSTEKAAVIYWPMVQIINYSLVPVFLRMAYFGCWGFVWIVFISHLRRNRDGPSAF
ncbi:mpv17-like protein [Narcine bancroftii]|uniref:mpv17-like protein n=1 Tax=Narcine bancroftii TaxID=1343680 RepID=UPI003831EF3E